MKGYMALYLEAFVSVIWMYARAPLLKLNCVNSGLECQLTLVHKGLCQIQEHS
jgi:hypothetical protein